MPPPPAISHNPEIWASASLLVVLAIVFAARQFSERANRAENLDDWDQRHFRRKDARRWSGCVFMGVIAALMFYSTRVPILDKPSARLWVTCWIAVLVLLWLLLGLAFADWLANRKYANRHRAALREEQREFWAGLVRKKQSPNTNGKTHYQ
jgi:hypothetical protein